jgi:hypothetical protein
MRSSLRLGSLATALILATLGVACAPSADEEPAASVDPAWKDTTETLGVTSWALVPSEDGESTTLTGYDDAHAVRSQFIVDRTQDAEGNVAVRIRSTVQGPAVMEFRTLPDKSIGMIQNTFKDHPDADRALSLAAANLNVPQQAPAGPLTTSSLHVLDNGPLIGNQQQLICKDSKGNACQKPPDMGGVTGVGAGCVAGVVGLAGTACLLSGLETIGIGCVVSAAGALYGAYTCYDGLSQRANCSCETPCAAQCHQTYNRQYMCPQNNSRSCSDAVAEDRRQESACVSRCGG